MSPMTKHRNLPQPLPTPRMLRVDAQDGPWSVSVAETPNDALSYTLYIKTPTHNLTLTRTAFEVVGLDEKLRDSHLVFNMPKLPIDMSTLPTPPKRKSAFLNTLSRLASPGTKMNGTKSVNFGKAHFAHNGASHLNGSAIVPSPIISPSQELNDPFGPIMASSETSKLVPPDNATITALAAYLTTIANDQIHRQTRVWKRFVRVRTEDLESVRVERAIKRVRSDLAAHLTHSSTDLSVPSASANESELSKEDADTVIIRSEEIVKAVPEHEDGMQQAPPDAATFMEEEEEEEEEAEDAVEKKPEPELPAPIDTFNMSSEVEEDEFGATPVQTDVSSSNASRILRSQSAEPSSRDRVSSLPLNGEDNISQNSQTTGDESSVSISTTGRRRNRKKRSQSADPNRELKKRSTRKVVVDDFEMMRVLGKGCAGKVLLVRHKATADLYALKAITKRHVLAHQELQHTLTEQAVLKRMAAEGKDPFVVKLWWSFHDRENLFLVMDFHPGGDLATQLARWGRLGRDRARFYAAEIVEGVEGLHANGVIYRDLKPENVLIGADGHIVLTDFGLSKEFPRRSNSSTAPSTPNGQRGESFANGSPSSSWSKEKGQDSSNGWLVGQPETTSTFCGTAEYLAPEVIQGLPYSFEVDWWSFGTMLYEMLTGITPFWASNHSDMYLRVLQDELQFPEDRSMDQDTKSLIRGLLQRNPALRMKEPRIKRHPYFSMIDWSHVYYKRYIPPYIPPIDPGNASDTQNFDETFLDMEPVIKDDDHENNLTDTDQEHQTDTDRTEGEDSLATPSQSRSPSVHAQEDDADAFEGYSFKGRHSVLLDDDEDTSEYGDEEDEDEEEDEPILKNGLISSEAVMSEDALAADVEEDKEGMHSKTPEVRPDVLPESSEEAPAPAPVEVSSPVVPPKQITPEMTIPVSKVEVAVKIGDELMKIGDSVKPALPPKAAVARLNVAKFTTRRREMSGVHALDSNIVNESAEPATELDDEDEDWDMVESGDGEEMNGAKGTSLFARGVVDRYKLAVFNRKYTPSRQTGRTVSGVSSFASMRDVDVTDSPTPSEKQIRGRNPGLTFRRKKPFSKTPPSSFSSKASTSSKSKSTTSTRTSSSTAVNSFSTATSMITPSLRSKQSAVSMTSPSESSDQSFNEETTRPAVLATVNKQYPPIPPERKKNTRPDGSKAKKRYKGALSIFASPR